jgi:hypothetical protein
MRLLTVFLLLGCASIKLPSPVVSSIDAQFQLARWKSRVSDPSHSESPGIKFYQRVLSQTLGSHCSYFPSDSRHAQLVFKTCGAAMGIGRAMARFYAEPDAPTLGYPIMRSGDRLLIKELRSDCDWF